MTDKPQDITWGFDVAEMIYRRSDGKTVLRETLSNYMAKHNINLEPRHRNWFMNYTLNRLADT